MYERVAEALGGLVRVARSELRPRSQGADEKTDCLLLGLTGAAEG